MLSSPGLHAASAKADRSSVIGRIDYKISSGEKYLHRLASGFAEKNGVSSRKLINLSALPPWQREAEAQRRITRSLEGFFTVTAVFDGDPDSTFSLKYNMAFDVLFGSGLFDSDVRERETDTYIAKSNAYGVPLDTRSTYTKSDWILWTTVLTDDIEKRKALIAPVAKFLRETATRYPFSDWYYSDSGLIRGEINRHGLHGGFKNRTVQGGIFAPLLKASGKMKQQGGKDHD